MIANPLSFLLKNRGLPARHAALALVMITASALCAAQTVRVGGTGAGLGTMQVLAQEFGKAHPSVSIVIVPNLGSSGGLKALAAGAVDIAVIARPLKAEETAQGLVAVEYGRTPFVIATARSTAPGLHSVADLVEIYSGRRAAWPDGTPIRLVLRPKHDSDFQLLESFSPEMKQAVNAAIAKNGMLVASTDQDAADALEKTPGAVGTSVLALLLAEKRRLNALPINGVAPTPKTLADGSYPYFKAMHLAHRQGAGAAAAQFVDFAGSARGRALLQETGHWVAAPARK